MATTELRGQKKNGNNLGTLSTLFSAPVRIAECLSCTTQPIALIKWNKIIKENVLWANLQAKSTFSGKRCNFSEVRRAASSLIAGIFDELAFSFFLVKQMDYEQVLHVGKRRRQNWFLLMLI